MASVCAYQMYKANGGTQDHWKFKHCLAEALINSCESRSQNLQSSIPSDILSTNQQHHPIDKYMHTRVKLGSKIAECKFQVRNLNPDSLNRYPTVNCGDRTTFGCKDCFYNNTVGIHLCKAHQIIHIAQNK